MRAGWCWCLLAGLWLGGATVVAASPRALSSNADESLETRLLAALPAELAVERARLRLGVADGAVYYRSAVAALAPAGSEFGWDALAGQVFCIAEGHDADELVARRYDATPRRYPSSAHALIGLKLGECKVVVEDVVLLQPLAELPEWQRYNRLLPSLADADRSLGLAADRSDVQERLQRWIRGGELPELVRQAVDEVAFQAYVLADTLDCH
ncbi:amino acid ABC transporter substrate-binding protein [Pseudomonas oligotrophica]|uniref:amino acid ABC transporter substrate-binding protein n=1 Tax=Pseudomonas oligotrophica TaxID=2912055 RepID=UPI001F285ABA|nr:amino acid ABC transporter substrate-binding protein [Pseudomonas oligotrophica]MCF7203403.1 amino acid ABC transporter substrate-binding protein [Pseudomonas oligotrophica]